MYQHADLLQVPVALFQILLLSVGFLTQVVVTLASTYRFPQGATQLLAPVQFAGHGSWPVTSLLGTPVHVLSTAEQCTYVAAAGYQPSVIIA